MSKWARVCIDQQTRSLTNRCYQDNSSLSLFAQIITPTSDNTAEILKGLRYILFAMNISNIQSFSVEKNRVAELSLLILLSKINDLS